PRYPSRARPFRPASSAAAARRGSRSTAVGKDGLCRPQRVYSQAHPGAAPVAGFEKRLLHYTLWSFRRASERRKPGLKGPGLAACGGGSYFSGTSQSRTVLSSLPERIFRPSGETATLRTGSAWRLKRLTSRIADGKPLAEVWPSKSFFGSQDQIRTDLSSLPA